MSNFTAAVFALVSLTATAGLASAQSGPGAPTTPGFELLVPSGTVVPTGAQDDAVTRGNMTAVQVSFGLRPDLVMTSTVGWTRATPRGLGPDARLHVYTYDAGLEYRLPRRSSDRAVNLKPFAGAGVGGRSHDYRRVDVGTRHDLSAYASVGGELGLSRVRLRLEVRDYLTWGTPLDAARATARNDVAVLAGLRLALR
jgi:hypothetical protein